MKKTNFFYAAAIALVSAFGMQSCSVEDNPSESIEPVKGPYVYDFAAVAEAGENPVKLNGNNANGQGFPWWESAEDPDRDRNGYKGYKWEEGSLLPEVCHVWLFNNQINGNVKDGGLQITQNSCAVAIDGVQSGSTVKIFYTAPEVAEQISLKDVPFGTWSAWVDGELTTLSNPDWHEGESNGLPYGDGSVIRYADLSAYAKLIVDVTEGEPRFLFNRDVKDGQWNADESQSHLIEYPKGNDVWSAKYFAVEEIEGGKRYTVDLAQMVKDKGYAHLHAIKGANWSNCTATSMKLEGFPTVENMIWAVGDGSKNNGGAPLSTATVDGAAAVSGVTAVPSGAEIKVLTAAPYAKSLPHIVVKAKKGMVITKVVITNVAE